jgi:hypothetical protein
MPFVSFMQRNPVLSVVLVLGLGFFLPQPGPTDVRVSIVGAEGWRSPQPASVAGPRLSVLETDAWRHFLDTGALEPVAQVPLPSAWDRRKDLLRGAHFTPEAYLKQIAMLRHSYSRQRDILMYYGGIRRRPQPEGLNFNAWSGENLRKLRELDCRPFIGLETMDKAAVKYLIWRLKEAGYGPNDRIYVRIGAEPAGSGYEKTPADYRKAFARISAYINAMNRKRHLNIHTVFAGTNAMDFKKYLPDEGTFDAIGYDLYVTPENKAGAIAQLKVLARRYPYKPLVLPEFGIATQGPMRGAKKAVANPSWAADALAEILEELSRHPAGVASITVFSVNVSGRMSARRWNWAWTPQMYEMLKEWQAAPHRWKKTGFHRYDPMSYPVGKDVLFLNRSDVKIVYRKLAEVRASGVPLFEETRFSLRRGAWVHQTRTVYFEGNATYLN